MKVYNESRNSYRMCKLHIRWRPSNADTLNLNFASIICFVTKMFVSEMIFVNRTSPCLQFKIANFNLKLMPVCYFRWTGRISGTISVPRRQIHVRLRHADMFMSFFMSQKIPERSSINHLNFYCIKQIASILPLSVQL